MVATPSFRLRRWAAWAPGREDRPAWRGWATGHPQPAETAAVDIAPVPMLLRRRVGTLGQQALRAAWAFPESATARLIFSSRHGEFFRTLSILEALERDEGLSPADFTLSVHHALAGLLSIARGNRRGHTAIAAGRESFGFAVIEAVACLAETPAEPVLLVHYDAPLPPPYADFSEDDADPLAVALVLAADGEGCELSLATEPATSPGLSPPPSPLPLPLDFLRLLLAGQETVTSFGDRLSWRWRRHGPVV